MIGLRQLIGVLFATAAVLGVAMMVSRAESESVPKPPPTGTVISGGLETIDSVLAANKGRWLMLNVWATWCRPCVAETPDLVAFADTMKDRPFTLVGLSTDFFTTDKKTAIQKVSAFQTKHSVPYTNLVFLGGTNELTKRLELSGVLPTTLVYDPSGKLAEQFIGLLEKGDLSGVAKRINGT